MMPTMPEFLLDHSLPTLFLLSFCASTLVPLGSEWLLVLLLLEGSNPASTVAVATLGNSLGSWTTYLVGFWGGDWLTRKVLHINQQQQQKAEIWFRRFGSWSLLLAWLPLVGDPLCLVSGALRTPFLRFIFLVSCGKGLRYLTLAVVTLRGAQVFS